MKRFKKKMTTVCMIAVICFGLVFFSGCAFLDAIFVAEAVMIANIFYVEYADDVDHWFRDLVFPDWAYGANEKETVPDVEQDVEQGFQQGGAQ